MVLSKLLKSDFIPPILENHHAKFNYFTFYLYHYYYLYFSGGQYYKKENPNSLQGPLKAARLCILSLLVPGILVIAPLYIRYHVYSDHKYPLAVTDMRILDQKMSTFWCQVSI